jgi:hypothetical protein
MAAMELATRFVGPSQRSRGNLYSIILGHVREFSADFRDLMYRFCIVARRRNSANRPIDFGDVNGRTGIHGLG